MSWDNIHARFGRLMPAGDYLANLDGTTVQTTREVAQAIYRERHDWPTLLDRASSHFAGGYVGDTRDAFYAGVLRAFDRPVPEYPAALRAQHEAQAAAFWSGVARFASAATSSRAATARQEEILESGRRQADADAGGL